jgi:hypothetical protein
MEKEAIVIEENDTNHIEEGNLENIQQNEHQAHHKQRAPRYQKDEEFWNSF